MMITIVMRHNELVMRFFFDNALYKSTFDWLLSSSFKQSLKTLLFSHY